ncbi:MAG TPA: hypothetical protein VKZ59_10100 [Acidobacteriota bacterium]|nr:hypothetical protein [Acidobacteriota bacterium]
MNIDTERIKAKMREELLKLESLKTNIQEKLSAIEVAERVAREYADRPAEVIDRKSVSA